jgi:Hypothetical protein (DUF2513).
MDLVEEILSEVRDTDPFAPEPEDFRAERLPGHWEIKKVAYHLIILVEEGFLARTTALDEMLGPIGVGTEESGDDEYGSGLRLTWNGHDLLEQLKEQSSARGLTCVLETGCGRCSQLLRLRRSIG